MPSALDTKWTRSPRAGTWPWRGPIPCRLARASRSSPRRERSSRERSSSAASEWLRLARGPDTDEGRVSGSGAKYSRVELGGNQAQQLPLAQRTRPKRPAFTEPLLPSLHMQPPFHRTTTPRMGRAEPEQRCSGGAREPGTTIATFRLMPPAPRRLHQSSRPSDRIEEIEENDRRPTPPSGMNHPPGGGAAPAQNHEVRTEPPRHRSADRDDAKRTHLAWTTDSRSVALPTVAPPGGGRAWEGRGHECRRARR
ncbi:unnamed protein product [Lampetra fluviatilis]